MDEIVINVEFEKENATESLSNELQVVSTEISWQDFELMVGCFLIFGFFGYAILTERDFVISVVCTLATLAETQRHIWFISGDEWRLGDQAFYNTVIAI